MSNLQLSRLEKLQWKVQKGLAYVVGLLCECQWRWVKNLFIRIFMYCYGIELKDCIKTQVHEYKNLNDFFTRQMKPEVRPVHINRDQVLSPVDGTISQMGMIEGEVLLQAKGKTYTLYDLLVGDEASIRLFRHGSFCNFYLAPSEYHRVHMPVEGTLRHTTYVPGFLFSVGARNTKNLSQLFTRNERILSLFDTPIGPLMMIQVGSYFVGHMGTSWEDKDTRPRRNKVISRIDYTDRNYHLKQADEMGYFKLGSTVIMLFAPDSIQWEEAVCVGNSMHYGSKLAKVLPRGIEPLFTP